MSTISTGAQPAKLSFFEVAQRFRKEPFGLMDELRHDYGEFVRLASIPILPPQYAVFSPALAYEILVQRADEFKKAELGKRLFEGTFGNGLFFSEGDFWRRQRKLAQPAFHHMRIRAYAKDMVARTNSMLVRWEQQNSIEIDKEMHALALRIVVEAIFKTEIDGLTDEIGGAMHDLGDAVLQQINSIINFLMPNWIPTPVNRQKKASTERLNKIIYKLIEDRRKSGEDAGDLISLFLQVRDEDTGESMSNVQVHDEVMTLFIAGHETSASALTWAFVELAKHPEIAQKLYEETDRVLAGRDATDIDYPNLIYTQQIIKEILRMYPPALFIARQPIHDLTLGGEALSSKALIQIMPYTIHRDTRWYPEPERFQPERWVDDFEKLLPKCVYLPFGAGPRICIGNGFAMMEMTLVLATVAQRFALTLAPDSPPVVPTFGITLGLKNPVRMLVEHR